jgi:pyruvate/2-oxoglutarate dehydrogenase complex dihydrolipoamide dehydrogenase (E3) component
LAALAPGRDAWQDLIDNKHARALALGVRFQFGTDASVEVVTSLAPDVVVLATGARPALPDMPGNALPHVATVEDVLAGRFVPGRKVLIVDLLDRQPAFTTALALAVAGHEVEVVTAATFVGAKLEPQTYAQLYRAIVPLGVRLTPHWVTTGFVAGGIMARHNFTRTPASLLGFDSVLVAAPGVAEDGLFHALSGKVPVLHQIGDCYTPRDVEAAILEGHTVARTL